jgi:putative PIG3 family NAD(P)H quinone oxidoreductase
MHLGFVALTRRSDKGSIPHPPGASDILGLEVAGTVEAFGPGVTEYQVGDPVCALLVGGGYSEFCVAPVEQVLPVPKGWSTREAAILPENIFTVWENVFRRAHLQAGETILVHGGTGGIGSTAIMLAREFGANAIATAGTKEKCQSSLAIGATAAINYKAKDFVTETLALTQGHGAGDYVQRDIDCLALHGRISLMANQGGDNASFSVASLVKRRGTIIASNLRPRTSEEKGIITRDLREKVWPRLSSRTYFRPLIDQVFTFAEAAKAHAHLERGELVGKILLLPR